MERVLMVGCASAGKSTFSRRLAEMTGLPLIHLDMPWRVCLWRVLRRTTLHYGRTRDDMTAHCPERFDWPFLRYVWHYERDHRPRLDKAMRDFNGTYVILRDRSAAEAYLSGLSRTERTGPDSRTSI